MPLAAAQAWAMRPAPYSRPGNQPQASSATVDNYDCGKTTSHQRLCVCQSCDDTTDRPSREPTDVGLDPAALEPTPSPTGVFVIAPAPTAARMADRAALPLLPPADVVAWPINLKRPADVAAWPINAAPTAAGADRFETASGTSSDGADAGKLLMDAAAAAAAAVKPPPTAALAAAAAAAAAATATATALGELVSKSSPASRGAAQPEFVVCDCGM